MKLYHAIRIAGMALLVAGFAAWAFGGWYLSWAVCLCATFAFLLSVALEQYWAWQTRRATEVVRALGGSARCYICNDTRRLKSSVSAYSVACPHCRDQEAAWPNA